MLVQGCQYRGVSIGTVCTVQAQYRSQYRVSVQCVSTGRVCTVQAQYRGQYRVSVQVQYAQYKLSTGVSTGCQCRYSMHSTSSVQGVSTVCQYRYNMHSTSSVQGVSTVCQYRYSMHSTSSVPAPYQCMT